ncbi:MAG: hypothetical protein IPJ52_01885 [Rhodocyclaceae bacterium]|nr:hypothetical protein [Rhodocyclaceae bacterium]
MVGGLVALPISEDQLRLLRCFGVLRITLDFDLFPRFFYLTPPCPPLIVRHGLVALRLPVLMQAGGPVAETTTLAIGEQLAPSRRVAVSLADAGESIQLVRFDHVRRV